MANAGGGPSRSDWRRKRNLRIGLMAAGLLLVVGVITVWPRGGDTDDVAAGRIAEPITTVDTSPFTLILPDGPTTIPDSELTTTTLPPPPRPTAPPTTTTTSTTIPIPTTTTTLPIPSRHSDPICQAFVELIEFARSSGEGMEDPVVFARRVLNRVDSWIKAMKELDPTTYAQAIDKLEVIAAKLRNRPSAEDLRAIMSELLTPDPRFAPLIAHRDRVCPSVGLAR